ncbi:MAG: choice-of-anchor B family protein [Candidatus Krumholzibacteriia bacterium]
MFRVHRPALCFLVLALAAPVRAQDSLNASAVGHQQLYGVYSDAWGYATQAGRELALISVSTGTSIVDVTDPANPVELNFVSGPNSVWRDIKTHATYAYIVTEGSGGGMQIVDLEADPPDIVATYSVNFDTAHNIAVADGVAYIIGAANAGSFAGTRFVSLADPLNPIEVGRFLGFYIHDVVVRNDTMYAAAINNDFLAIVDVTNKAAPFVVTSFTWEGNNAHSCDLTTDGRYLLTTDEVTGGDLHIFDIADLGNIQQVATWGANPDAIIHNVYVRDNLAFLSYYTEGLRILDISNPEFPVEVGFYDTFPGVSGGFNGAWGAYPYTPSGHIYVSDINTGLYVVRFELLSAAVEGTVSESGVGTPIAGADVSVVGGPATVSNGAGFFKIIDDPGTRTVVVSRFGFLPDSSTVDLVMGTTLTHDVELVRVPSSAVSGVVRNASTSVPIGSASMVLDGTPLVDLTDGSGGYAFPSVPYGVYTLGASRFGFAPRSQTITVTTVGPFGELRFDFDLQPASLVEDFESGPAGWSDAAPDDDATTGRWVWSDPVGSGGGAVQPEDDHTLDPGALCWVTGNAPSPSSNIGTNDVDNGKTTLTTPVFDLSLMANARLSYWRWYSNDAGSIPGPPDTLRVDITNDGGMSWVPVEKIVDSASWTRVDILVSDYVVPTSIMLMRFIAEDINTGSIVEAALDDFMAFDAAVTDAPAQRRITRLYPNVPNPFNPSTTIRFELGRSGRVELRVFDGRGRLVRQLVSERLDAGLHERAWNGRDEHGRQVASGVYLYRLVAPGFVDAHRMLLLK